MPLSPRTLGLAPSFGFGDRIGNATAGHVAAMLNSGKGIAPIFPQQSIREMARTGRSPEGVMQDALRGAENAGWTDLTGADADHLKTEEDVNRTVAAGFTFFTIDPSGYVDQQADDYDTKTLDEKFAQCRELAPWFDIYANQSIPLPSGNSVELTETACIRAAVKYGRAIQEAIALGEYIAQQNRTIGRDFEIELSVDETDQPTTLAEHYIIADQCLKGGMKLVSLAPRFIGDFEKGVDYKGDLQALEASLEDHAAIASELGPYKLSLHSGSDKLSIYAMLARATRGMFHVKTAGTSYLEALRVVARHDEPLFRRIINFARERYNTDRATYHVSATLENTLSTAELKEAHALEQHYLECWDEVPAGKGFTAPGRQILHCTFGSVLTSHEFGPLVKQTLDRYHDTYTAVLTDHFSRHLEALQDGLN